MRRLGTITLWQYQPPSRNPLYLSALGTFLSCARHDSSGEPPALDLPPLGRLAFFRSAKGGAGSLGGDARRLFSAETLSYMSYSSLRSTSCLYIPMPRPTEDTLLSLRARVVQQSSEPARAQPHVVCV